MTPEDEKISKAIDKLSSKALLALEWVLRYRTSKMTAIEKQNHIFQEWGEYVMLELTNAGVVE